MRADFSEEIHDGRLPELISFKNGQWSGDSSLMKHIEKITSTCGITGYELYKKTLKEYKNYKSIYDMSHNRGFLLHCKVMALSQKCSMRTVPYSEGDILTIISEIFIPTNDVTKPLERRYPMLPKEIIHAFSEMFVSCIPYMSSFPQDNESVRQRLINNFKISFYSNWQTNIAGFELYTVTCLNQLLSLIPNADDKVTCSNIMNRIAKKLNEDVTEVVNTTILQQSWFTKLIKQLMGR